ncbi:phage major capsid protein [Sinomonas sp. P47F7]|uniref:phage major capsid protein n=1 Tax=Sinomonas sp. P47F7 TaxID=3410987 RepID=UPI003BF5BEC7
MTLSPAFSHPANSIPPKASDFPARIRAKSAERQNLANLRASKAAEIEQIRRDPSQNNRLTSLRGEKVDLDDRIDVIDTELKQLRSVQAEEERARAADKPGASGVTHFRGDGRPAYDGVIRTGDTKEPRVYTSYSNTRAEGEAVSFFADAAAWMANRENPARGTKERLLRHAAEVELHGEQSARAAGTGTFAGLVVPQYLTAQNALVLRAGRPFANLCRRFQIPEQGMSFVIPRGTTGASTSPQTAENTAVSATDDVWANVTVPVVTGAGAQDVSRQLLERGAPGIDQVLYSDLVRAYAGANPAISGNAASQFGLGWAVINGSGSSGQPLGALNTSGIGASTAMGGPVTTTLLNLKLAGGFNSIMTAGAGIVPRAIVMHPRRWTWLLAQVDSTGRPVVQPNTSGTGFNTIAQSNAIQSLDVDTPIAGFFQGLPVVIDWNLPTNVGTPSEDVILVADTSQCLLFEDGDGLPRELSFEQTTGGSLTTKLVVYGYYAFTAGRYPAAVAKVGGADTVAGNGCVAPAF